MIGKTLSHYRIEEELGAGGMGVVYKALDTELNRYVAIKMLPQALTADPERRLRKAAQGEHAGTIAAYRKIFEPMSRLEVVLETQVLSELARLQEGAGDLESAKEHYREYLSRWGEADLPIPEVPEAKARLTKLEAQ